LTPWISHSLVIRILLRPFKEGGISFSRGQALPGSGAGTGLTPWFTGFFKMGFALLNAMMRPSLYQRGGPRAASL